MSVATFDDTMASLVCEIDDRKIYNDIRSEINVTITNIVLDEPATYLTKRTPDWFWAGGGLANSNYVSFVEASGTKSWIIQPHPSDYVYSWINAFAYYSPYLLDTITTDFTVTITEEFPSYAKVDIKNNTAEDKWGIYLGAFYDIQILPLRSHPEAYTKNIIIRTIDSTSIDKYGRRTMNLTWPLGQTQQQMESLIAGYLALYKDPKPYTSMILAGTTDALILQILTRKVSEAITVISSRLGLNGDFFICNVDISHDTEGLLIGNYLLEEISTIQSVPLFILDTSELDGIHILGW